MSTTAWLRALSGADSDEAALIAAGVCGYTVCPPAGAALSQQEIRDAVKEALQTRFLPEFLNRIDETIVFHPLDEKHITKIVRIQVKKLEEQAARAGITLECTEKAITEIARLGYDPTYGARPLKRVIQQQLQNPLAKELLSGRFPEGSRVKIEFVQDEFIFQPE